AKRYGALSRRESAPILAGCLETRASAAADRVEEKRLLLRNAQGQKTRAAIAHDQQWHRFAGRQVLQRVAQLGRGPYRFLVDGGNHVAPKQSCVATGTRADLGDQHAVFLNA